MKVLIVLDGAAEDIHPARYTSLQQANTPFLDSLARKSMCGLFDPHDQTLRLVKTDLIIAAILGIRPPTWPGRAYFEVLDLVETAPSMCSILRYKDDGSAALDAIGTYVTRRIPVSNLAQSYGLQIAVRKGERRTNSHLVWAHPIEYGSGDELRRLTCFAEELRILLPSTIQMELDQTWSGDPISIKNFTQQPCQLMHAEGSLSGLCKQAGIRVTARNGHPLDLAYHSQLLQEIVNATVLNQMKCLVIYYKAPDWASHIGDQALKNRALELVDTWVGTLFDMFAQRGDVSLLIISDHRTNLNASAASDTPSIFLQFPGSTESAASDFSEQAIEQVWARTPLTLSEMHALFLGES